MKFITDPLSFRLIAIISLILFCTDCIDPFDPQIQGKSGVLVVDGSIIKGRQTQVITISKTSSISDPGFLPVENCHVMIVDNTGNEFAFDEESPGRYVSNIDDAWLNYGMQYKLKFTTSSGREYESEYQELLRNYPVDSVYAIPENHYSSVTGSESVSGIQFYVDLDAPQDAPRYYRWVAEETWEKRIDREIWGEYDGAIIKPFIRRDSLQRCWVTVDATGLYSASTINLSENRIKKIPLHFVDRNSPKMAVKYCATIKQYALNADAYDYWFEKQKELNESGNIYTNQPCQPKSNIFSVNYPDEQVLGFFWAASCAEKRVFVNFPFTYTGEENCSYVSVFCESKDTNEILASLYSAFSSFADMIPKPPVYITVERNAQYDIVLTPICADCRVLGGDIQKPYFWEDDK